MAMGVVLGGWTLAADPVASSADPETESRLEYFEEHIRPVLVQHCYECHSVEGLTDANDGAVGQPGGGLWVDSAVGLTTGGDSGPAVVGGKPEESVLLAALRYESSEMPPEGRLSDETIDHFEKWIRLGAIDPRDSTSPISQTESKSFGSIDLDAGRKFWAFRPIADPEKPPVVSRRDRPGAASGVRQTDSGGTIDRFLQHARSRVGVEPAGPAEPAALLRRLYFDLTGLPPSVQAQRDFESNPSPVHYREIVDRLLASEAYAIHWARHWMDVVRYADSNGSDFNATFHDAWRYRDYLIDAWAEDRPFDRLITEQIAGDLLPHDDPAQRREQLVATGYLMLGTKMLSERDKAKLQMDVVDEQIDLVGRTLMGMTLGCARCHHHKFDPIPTEDYYALAGIFTNTRTLHGESQQYVSTWTRTPLPEDPSDAEIRRRYEADVNRAQVAIENSKRQVEQTEARIESLLGVTLIDDSEAKQKGGWTDSTYTKPFVGAGYVHDNNANKGQRSIEFAFVAENGGRGKLQLAGSSGGNRASAIPVSIEIGSQRTEVKINQRKVSEQPFWHDLGEFDITPGDPVRVTVSNKGTDGYVVVDAVRFIRVDDDPVDAPEDDSKLGGLRTDLQTQKEELGRRRQRLDRIRQSAPPPRPLAMAVIDEPDREMADCQIRIRGEAHHLGDSVPRGVLQVCGNGDASFAEPSGSGRLELARWLTDPDHPLVARVYVNRVWMHLMGEGIVRTVDNFGTRGQRPDHPELLDALATQFVRSGWQTKPLIRRIVMSDAYRMSSEHNEAAAEVDPENRLWHRQHRKRLPAEAIRETMLMTAGKLDRTRFDQPMIGFDTLVTKNNGGGNVDASIAGNYRRTIFLPLIRNHVSPFLVRLDLADPDLIVGRRVKTSVPGQALVLLNSDVVDHLSREAADRMLSRRASRGVGKGLLDDDVQHSIRQTLHRQATSEELSWAHQWFADDGSDPDNWRTWYASLMACSEFRMVD